MVRRTRALPGAPAGRAGRVGALHHGGRAGRGAVAAARPYRAGRPVRRRRCPTTRSRAARRACSASSTWARSPATDAASRPATPRRADAAAGQGARRPAGPLRWSCWPGCPTPTHRPACTWRSPTAPARTGGWLTSASTAPARVPAAGRPRPDRPGRAGPADPRQALRRRRRPRCASAGRPADLADAVARLADADREAGVQRRVPAPVLHRARRRRSSLLLRRWSCRCCGGPAGRRGRSPHPPDRRRPAGCPAGRRRCCSIAGRPGACPAALRRRRWCRGGGGRSPGSVFAAVTGSPCSPCATAVVAARAAAPRARSARSAGSPRVAALAVGARRAHRRAAAAQRRRRLLGAGGRPATPARHGRPRACSSPGVLLAAGCLAQRCAAALAPVLVVAGRRRWRVIVVGSPYLGADAAARSR